MARISGLTVATVSAAVEAIKARGERVTLRSVRGELGEGSLTTIQRLLGEIGEDRPAAKEKKTESATTLPARIAQAINAEIEAAAEAVRSEMQLIIERLQADLEASMQENARLQERAQELEEETETCRRISDARMVERDAAEKQLAALKLEKKETEEKLEIEREKRQKAELLAGEQSGLAKRMQDVALELRNRIDQLETDLKASVQENAQLQERVQEQVKEIEKEKENRRRISDERMVERDAAEKQLAAMKVEKKATEEKLEAERENRHKAELLATEQSGLAQRMQDIAIELRQRIEKLEAKPKPAPRNKTSNATGSGK